MPKPIVTILGRLRRRPRRVSDSRGRPGHRTPSRTHLAERLLDPVTTLYLFLMQVLHGNTAVSHVVHFGDWSFTDSAYCQAHLQHHNVASSVVART